MRIIVDVDSVVADLVKAIVEIYDPELKTIDEPKVWNWFNELEHFNIQKHLCDYKFWKNLPLIKDSKEGIQFLRSQNHELVWVTMPYQDCFGWHSARHEWLNDNFHIDLHNEPLVTISGGKKYIVKAAAMIDDCVDFVEQWEKVNNGIGFVFKSQLNNQYKRRYTWETIMKDKFFTKKTL